MNEVVEFTRVHRYDVVLVENVVEVTKWDEFDDWWREMTEKMEYTGQVACLNAMFFHPVPQSRDRVFFVFTRRGIKKPNLEFNPTAYCLNCDKDVPAVQSWKPGSHLLKIGKYKEQYIYCCPSCGRECVPYYYCAASVVDWSLPFQPVVGRVKPMKNLVPSTLARIQRGLNKKAYLPVAAAGHISPFLIDTCFGDSKTGGSPRNAVNLSQPYPTATTRQSVGLVIPPFVSTPYQPVPEGKVAFISCYYGQDAGHKITEAVSTVTTVQRHALIIADDLPEVKLTDCGFRMIEPDEIARAMSFEPGYIVCGTKREQVVQYGHAIPPAVITAIGNRCMEVFS